MQLTINLKANRKYAIIHVVQFPRVKKMSDAFIRINRNSEAYSKYFKNLGRCIKQENLM